MQIGTLAHSRCKFRNSFSSHFIVSFLFVCFVAVMAKKGTIREYFKCRGCYMKVWDQRITQHHVKAHPRVSHAIYLDTYFDLSRPLYKCDCCSIKLEVNQLIKHRRLAHRNKDNTFLKYKLPVIQHLNRNRLKSSNGACKLPMVDLTFDQLEDGEIDDAVAENTNAVTTQSIDKVIQCEPAVLPVARGSGDQYGKWDTADKCIGEHCETSDQSTNTTHEKQLQDGNTQTESEPIKESNRPPLLPAKQLSVEYDEDGFLEMVLF